MANKENKRVGNITQQQKELLIEYLTKHLELQSGKFSAKFTMKRAQELWEEELSLLHTCHDLRSNVKAKKASILKPLPENEQLISVEDKIVDLVGPTAVSGNDKVSEPVVTFDFNTKIE
ncbi:hypothetical protein RN001_008655 [Aquatica leii]|uniref:Uncharacterized protein n=1 Tax=Aquatica leii TaxID=1421715 RepID=A0AAN7PAK8_9COLE|nr:hypothetical protein RN001_008655 [Aquatica leii]